MIYGQQTYSRKLTWPRYFTFVYDIYFWASSWDYHLSHRRPVTARVHLRIHAVSPEPSLFAHMKYGSRWRVRPKIGHLALLDGCICAFEEWVYGGWKVPYHNDPKFLDRYAWANSADPDQSAPLGAVWSVSTLFAIPSASFGLITIW